MFGEPELSSDTSISRSASYLYLLAIVRDRALPAVPTVLLATASKTLRHIGATIDFAIMASIY